MTCPLCGGRNHVEVAPTFYECTSLRGDATRCGERFMHTPREARRVWAVLGLRL